MTHRVSPSRLVLLGHPVSHSLSPLLCARHLDVARAEVVLEDALTGATIVVNATPIGLHGQAMWAAVT